jgi:hypothetical protein
MPNLVLLCPDRFLARSGELSAPNGRPVGGGTGRRRGVLRCETHHSTPHTPNRNRKESSLMAKNTDVNVVDEAGNAVATQGSKVERALDEATTRGIVSYEDAIAAVQGSRRNRSRRLPTSRWQGQG